jgi:hypothetical protein
MTSKEENIKSKRNNYNLSLFFRIQSYRFDAMNPYHRMLVHRIGAFFCLRHNVDQTKQCVIVSKLEKSRVYVDLLLKKFFIIMIINFRPGISFQSLIPPNENFVVNSENENTTSSQPPLQAPNATTIMMNNTKKQILKREINNDQDNNNNDQNKLKFNNGGKQNNETIIKPIKTYEEKTAEYLRVKNRIFNNISQSPSSSSLLNNKNDIRLQQQQQQQQVTILNRQQSNYIYKFK